MRSLSLTLLVLLASVSDIASQPKAPAAKPKPVPMQILVPAYFYPGGEGRKEWAKMAQEAKKVTIVAIVNPNSGPGENVDPNYTKIITDMNNAGIVTIGYISTDYGKARAKGTVENDLKNWQTFYPQVKGYFLDEQASDKATAPKYIEWCKAIRKQKPKGMIVSNPGTICEEEYFKDGGPDNICVHETSTSLKEFNPPAWMRNLPAQRLSILLHSQKDKKTMEDEVDLAKKKGVGMVYVTDKPLTPNPWDRLPVYWKDLVKEVRSKK
jgi:hypothetical protein